jgi:hypothetical protein
MMLENLALALTFILGTLTLAAQAQAEQPTGFLCWPSWHDSRLVVYQKGDSIKFKVSNPLGYAMMPQYEGPVSQSQIAAIQMQTQELSALTDQFELSWNKKDCTLFKPETNQVYCNGPADTGVPGLQAYVANSFKVTEENPQGINVSYKYRVSLSKGGNTYFITLTYPQQFCKAFE